MLALAAGVKGGRHVACRWPTAEGRAKSMQTGRAEAVDGHDCGRGKEEAEEHV
jgi:hypothetical protein